LYPATNLIVISFRLLQGLFGSRARIFDHLEPNLGNREFYSITCSALANTLTGIVMPREFAVFKLITSSNFVDCSTGTSAGFAPCSILSATSAARRYMVEKFTP